jgi:putative transposase
MKPGTFTQLYIHLVFAVKNRETVLSKNIRNRVFEYMSGIANNMKHKSIIINGVTDHVHILLGLNPAISISDTVHDLKRNSSLFINNEKLSIGRFSWQEGYGGFTYSRSQLHDIYHYIEHQEEHHKKKTFQAEYIGFLEKFGIEFDKKYLFDFFDDIV